ncbi:hypothetical protein EBESD8_14470 [Rhodococcus aetherivorans]|nr:hypothetical protein EBESD8_14470 [Rhodococcus aetherivorans]
MEAGLRRRALAAALPALSVALTGITNLTMTVGVQAFAGIETLGAFSLIYAPAVVGLAIQRLVLSQTLMRGAHVSRVAGLPLALVLMWMSFPGLSALMSVIVSGPAVFKLLPLLCCLSLFQDFLRYMFLGAKVPAAAFGSDLVWFVIGVLGLATAIVVPGHALELIIGTQIVGATISAAALFRVRSRIGTIRIIKTAPVGHLLTEAATISTLPQVSQYIIAGFVGISVVGEFRSAQLLIVPVTMLATQAQAIVFPRLDPEDRSAVKRWSLLCGTAAGILGLVLMFARAINPLGVFDLLGFGDSSSFYWTLGALTLGAALSLYLMIYMVRIRIVLPQSYWLRWRIGAAVIEPLASVGAGIAFGAPGLALGFVTSNAATLVGLAAKERITPVSGSPPHVHSSPNG